MSTLRPAVVSMEIPACPEPPSLEATRLPSSSLTPLTYVRILFQLGRVTNRWNMSMMQHDPRLREAARAIYEACYPSDEWAQFAFDEAERYGTVHYRQAVDGALAARACLAAAGEQLALPVT